MKKDKPSECGIRNGESGTTTPFNSPFEKGDSGGCRSAIRNPQSAFCSGFTLLEVIVALAIVSISLGVYMSLIGASFRLKGKVDDHAKKVLVAIQKAEEAHLGLLVDKNTSGDNPRVRNWVMKDGTAVGFVENDKQDIEKRNKPVDGLVFYDVVVGGINISSIRSENILAQSASDKSGQQADDKKNKSKTGSTTQTHKPGFNKKK